jgi:hypothetical protein
VFDGSVNQVLQEECLGIGKRYQIKFLEIGNDQDPVYFLAQSMPMLQRNKNSNNKLKVFQSVKYLDYAPR